MSFVIRGPDVDERRREEFERAVARLDTRVTIGGFICAVGYGVLVLAAAIFVGAWKNWAAQSTALLPLLTAALAVWRFYGLRTTRLRAQLLGHREGSGPLVLRGGPINARWWWWRNGSMAVAAAVFVASVAWFVFLAGINEAQPSYSEFAVSLPSQSTVLLWNVEQAPKTVPAGAFPIFLGSLLTMAFGIWFPTIDLAETQSAMGLSEKLVAPLLSVALVALGAGQQADANKVAADKELAQQGLPPSIRVAPDQRIYLPKPTDLSPGSVAYLTNSIQTLSEKLGGDADTNALVVTTNSANFDAQALRAAVNGVEVTLRNPVPVTVQTSDATLKQLASEIGGLRVQVRSVQAGDRQAADTAQKALDQASSTTARVDSVGAQLRTDTETYCRSSRDELTALRERDGQATAAEDTYTKHFHPASVWAVFGVPDAKLASMRNERALLQADMAHRQGVLQSVNCDAVLSQTAQAH